VLKEERHRIILNKVNEKKIIKICDLVDELEATEMTLRRDLTYLESKGLLIRIHGGARSNDSFKEELSLSEKRNINIDKKLEIAKIVGSLVKENDIIYIGPGTTNELIYDYLNVSYAKIVTNSLSVFEKFKDDSRYDVILIGGKLRHRSNTFIGNFANEICKKMIVDLAFVGTNGILDNRVTTRNEDEGICQNIILEKSKKPYILCDSTKFELEDFCTFYKLNKDVTIITDSNISKELKDKYLKICNVIDSIEQ
jgi:DeoR family lactose phosphotransferase system repressor